jgi:MarR family transcriptional regulator, organic hydroperoxide resistance regulator
MEKGELINQVIELHRKVNRSLRMSTWDAWMQLSLTVPQVKSLFFITDRGTTNFKNLATALKVTQSNLTGVIDRLVDQDMVSRTENPEDRRMVLLKATDRGEALVSDLRERRISHLSQALSDLSTEDLDFIVRGLSLLARVTETQKHEITI